jgi:hypothetical protein
VEVRITPELAELLSIGVSFDNIVGIISSNLEYILALEYGHSQGQAPTGMIRNFSREHDAILLAELTHALEVYRHDVRKAVKAGVSMATLEIMRAIAERTPVDTGRAKGSWIATLPGGQRLAPEGVKPVSEAQQRAVYRTKKWREKAAARRRERRSES